MSGAVTVRMDHLRHSVHRSAALASLLFACGGCASVEEARPVVDDDAIVQLASGDMFMPAAGFGDNGGHFVAFAVGGRSARLVSIESTRPWSFGSPERLPWVGAQGATGVSVAGVPTLYFVATIGAAPLLHRASATDGPRMAPSPVTVRGAKGTPWWPQTAALPDGHVLLAFVEPQARVFVGIDDANGARFDVDELRLPEPSLRGVLAHVGVTAEGTWLLTYQVADESWKFRSKVLMSRDRGASWGTSEAVTLSSDDDVSDAFPIARPDHGADVYYVTNGEVRRSMPRTTIRQRSVRRRVVREDGTLGPEQVVLMPSDGADVAMPRPCRLEDGRIALMLTVQRMPGERTLALAILDEDAPL